MPYLCANCGHGEDDHWNSWAECDKCGCMLFELGAYVEEDTENEVLTLEEDGV